MKKEKIDLRCPKIVRNEDQAKLRAFDPKRNFRSVGRDGGGTPVPAARNVCYFTPRLPVIDARPGG